MIGSRPSVTTKTFVAALMALALAQPASAWDTAEDGGWRSIYIKAGIAGHINEHALIAHDSLDNLGQHIALGMNADLFRRFFFVDVSGAVFHETERDVDLDGDTSIEERPAPSPTQFAGLPDFSYSIYDWIHKNDHALCPGVPTSADPDRRCHQFFGWLGALNANHFGTQGRELYTHLHLIALELAQRAADMRQLLELHPLEARIYADYLIEAQLEALYFEGYAQHYVQDRWSMGHMWERWNGSDYASIPKLGRYTFHYSLAIGFLAGLVHGSEAVRRNLGEYGYAVGVLDELCAPEITPSMRPLGGCPRPSEVFALPMQFRSPGGGIVNAIGDYHYFDMKEGRIDTFCQSLTLEWVSQSYRPILPVFEQKRLMADCVDQGWHDVLRALDDPERTPNKNPGKELGELATFGGRNQLECWGNWATNASMYQSWVEDDLIRVADFARTIIEINGNFFASLGVDVFRHAMGNIGARMTLWSIANPHGTELSRGGALPRLFSARSGDAYVSPADPVPDWTMPAGFSDPGGTALPWRDDVRGRDQQTMFGFFNRAHADFWCRNPARVAALRGSQGDDDDDDDLARIEACTLLADRFYLGSDPSYQGLQTELRELDFAESAELGVPPFTPYQSVCQLLGVDTTNDPETLPVHVHAGYVASPGVKTKFGHGTIESWCRQVPVLDYLWMDSASVRDRHHWDSWDDEDRWDVVALADREGGEIVMHGLNLDSAGGVISLSYIECNTDDCGDGGGETELIERYRVSGKRATFTLPADMAVGDYAIRLLPDAGPEPVGRFRLRVIAQPLSAPLVLWVEMYGSPFGDPLKPGEDAFVEAEVYDPDGWIDLDATKGAFVDVYSEVLAGFGWVVLDSSVSTGLETASFWNATPGTVAYPLSDRLSSCPPPEYLVKAEATDTGLSIDDVNPVPLTGPIHEGETIVTNCDPAPGSGAAPMAAADPGGSLKFTVTWADDNHDGAPGCDELPAGFVTFQAQPANLDTAPQLPALTWTGTVSAPPERTFVSDGATVENPHRDGEFQGSITTMDDLMTAPTGNIGATIVVKNVAPKVPTVVAKPAALHPNEEVALTVTVTATDDNFGIDIPPTGVDVDLTGLNSTVDKAVGAGGANDRQWRGVRVATIKAPPGPPVVKIPVIATDDNGARGLGEGAVKIENVKPVVSGVGFVWDDSGQIGTPDDGIIRACEELTVAAIATDDNEDALEIEVVFTQAGATPVTVKLPKGEGNTFIATIDAPCPGTWTLSYTAVEIHPAGSERTTRRSDPKTLTLTVHPALDPCACQKCVCFAKADNTACDDCKTCTESSSCQGGVCQGVQKQCPQDDNPCTEASCDESDGECKDHNVPNGERSCDGDVCTNPDRCVEGTCIPGATNPLCCHRDADCFDDRVCTLDECDEATGVCSNPPLPNGTGCSDGINCTANDACFAGVCGGVAITCPSAGNACTTERCDEADGRCKSFPANDNGDCEDGDECTVGDFCDDGACRPGPLSSDCCEDDQDCDDGEDCTIDTCNQSTNACSHEPVAEPASCDDGDLCTDPDSCSGGVCGGVATSCASAGNFCSTEECDPSDGQCKSFPANQGELCDDGDECTESTVCEGTVCGGGTTISCCPDESACEPEGACTGSGEGRCLDGMCMLHFQTLSIPADGAVYPGQAGAPSLTLPDWLDMELAEVRYGLPSDVITQEPCDVTGVTIEMRDVLPEMGDSSFIDIGIWYFDPNGQGDPGTFGPPLYGATHALSVSWNDADDVWEGHLWAYGMQPGSPAASWYIVDGAVPFVINGDTITIERSIPDFEGCVPHKLLTQYIDGDNNLVWKMVTQGENGLSLDPNQQPLQCPGATLPVGAGP